MLPKEKLIVSRNEYMSLYTLFLEIDTLLQYEKLSSNNVYKNLYKSRLEQVKNKVKEIKNTKY